MDEGTQKSVGETSGDEAASRDVEGGSGAASRPSRERQEDAAGLTISLSPSVVRLLPVALLFVFGLIAYLDLKSDLRELRAERAAASPSEGASSGAAQRSSALSPDGIGEPPSSDAPAARPPATLPREQWRCAGTVPTDALRESVGRHGRAIFGCHERLEKGGAKLQGIFVLDLLIGADGRPRNGAFGGSLTDAELQQCVKEAIPTWQFPVPVGGECAIVTLPFQLGVEPKP